MKSICPVVLAQSKAYFQGLSIKYPKLRQNYLGDVTYKRNIVQPHILTSQECETRYVCVRNYCKLLEVAVESDCVYPSIEDIAYGMGEMLGRLHWCVGYDGRDVEFIMGGASFSGVAMYIIDCNQVCR